MQSIPTGMAGYVSLDSTPWYKDIYRDMTITERAGSYVDRVAR